MKKILGLMGVIMLAQLGFVGLVHLMIRVQGKDSPETMRGLHGMPIIGGYFSPPEADPNELTPEQIRDLLAIRRLRESLDLYDFPPGFSREELEALAHDLASAVTENQQNRIAVEDERRALTTERQEVAAQRSELEKMGTELLRQADALEAKQAELAQQQNLMNAEEERNLKVIRATYEKMQPTEAANILNLMDADVVAKILNGMSERISARILQEMEDTRAVEITRRILALAAR